MLMLRELLFQPDDAILMHFEDRFWGDTRKIRVRTYFEVGHQTLAGSHLGVAGEIRPEGGA